MLVIHRRLIMGMTENAFENGKVVGIHMAIDAGIPFSLVFSGIDGEIHSIVIPGDLIPIVGGMA